MRKPCSPSSAADVLGGLGDAGGRDADVLDDQRRLGGAHLADEAVQALAHAPVHLDRLGVAAELRVADQLVGRDQLRGALLVLVEGRGVLARELDEQRRRLGRQLLPVVGGAVHVVAGDDQGGSDHQLDGARARLDQLRHEPDRGRDVGEVQPRTRRQLGDRNGLERGLGDERQRPLRADQQAAEDLQRGSGVEEGAEAVAGRVLDLELAADAIGELAVGADLVADLVQPRGELGLGRGEALLGAVGGGVDRRSPTAARTSAR